MHGQCQTLAVTVLFTFDTLNELCTLDTYAGDSSSCTVASRSASASASGVRDMPGSTPQHTV